MSALVAAAVLALVPALPAAAADDDTAGERITAYDVQLAVRPDGSLGVQETIAYDFGGLLPYAVALGLAPRLASAFLAAGVVAGGYAYTSNPMWWSTFAGDATRATSPASSSSGGGSGFSGGSAGGGGGGGGGGSW